MMTTLCATIFTLLLFIQHGHGEGCYNPGSISHGSSDSFKMNEIGIGDKIAYSCDKGYILTSDNILTCQKDGTWDKSPPSCLEVMCGGLPNMQHTGLHFTGETTSMYQYGHRAYFKCEGRAWSSDPAMYIICDDGGVWTSSNGSLTLPQCAEEYICLYPVEIPHATMAIDNGVSIRQSKSQITVYYTCEPGYKLKNMNEDRFVCSNMQWRGNAPECVEQESSQGECTQPGDIPNGYYSFTGGALGRSHNGLAHGTNVHYKCTDKYSLVGLSKMTCDDGVWIGKPPLCVPEEGSSVCLPPPKIADGDYNIVNPQKDFIIGIKIIYYCHNGYRMDNVFKGQAFHAECIRTEEGINTWQGKVPVCFKRDYCDDPADIQNGRWEIGHLGPGYKKFSIGTTVNYECDDKYQAYGHVDMECEPSGYWSNYPPRCLPKGTYCADPGEIENGRYTCLPMQKCGMFKVGIQVQFFCNEGFEPEGSIVISCTEGGNWSDIKPFCAAVQTTPHLLNHVEINSNTMTIVISTACTVLALLLMVMIIVALQRRKPLGARFCRHAYPPPPPPYISPPSETSEEHDRVGLIAFPDGQSVVLPSYEEAVRTNDGCRAGGRRMGDMSYRGGYMNDYRPLPSVHHSSRSRPDSIRSVPAMLPSRHESHRNSTVTINSTSTATRDNTSMSVSLPFGSMDTMNISDGTSTSVTIETYDSGASNPSLALSQRATAGSIGSSNNELASEDAPLLDSSKDSADSVQTSINLAQSPSETTAPPIDEPPAE